MCKIIVLYQLFELVVSQINFSVNPNTEDYRSLYFDNSCTLAMLVDSKPESQLAANLALIVFAKKVSKQSISKCK